MFGKSEPEEGRGMRTHCMVPVTVQVLSSDKCGRAFWPA